MRADTYFGIKYNRGRSINTFRRDRRATHSTFYRRAGSVIFRITDHTSTPVELDTRYDQRSIDMDISSPTARVMVPRGVDQRLTNRLSSRPGSSRQRDIATMLRETSRRGCHTYTPEKNADGTRGRKQIGYDSTWYVQFRTISTWIIVRQPGSYTLHGKLKFFFRWILYHWDLYNAYPADNKSVSLS